MRSSLDGRVLNRAMDLEFAELDGRVVPPDRSEAILRAIDESKQAEPSVLRKPPRSSRLMGAVLVALAACVTAAVLIRNEGQPAEGPPRDSQTHKEVPAGNTEEADEESPRPIPAPANVPPLSDILDKLDESLAQRRIKNLQRAQALGAQQLVEEVKAVSTRAWHNIQQAMEKKEKQHP